MTYECQIENMNEYYKCLANKNINGQKLTIIWNLEDLKISHVDKILVEDIINSYKQSSERKAHSPQHVVVY